MHAHHWDVFATSRTHHKWAQQKAIVTEWYQGFPKIWPFDFAFDLYLVRTDTINIKFLKKFIQI